MTYRFPRSLLFAFLLVACSSDRALAPRGTILTDNQVTADIVLSSGVAVVWDLGRLEAIPTTAGANLGAVAEVMQTPWKDPACVYSSNPGKWTCKTTTEKGLATTRVYSYLDVAGKPMQKFDELTTETVLYQSSADGVVSRDTSLVTSVHRTRSVSVTGLKGSETSRKWNVSGASADTIIHRDNGSVRKYAGLTTDSLINVVIPMPHRPDSWPLSGSSIRAGNFIASTSGKEIRSVSRRVVTTYNGSALVRIQIGTRTCTLHLDTHSVEGCSG